MSCRSEQRTIVNQSVSLAPVVAIWATLVCPSSYAQWSSGAPSNTSGKIHASLTIKSPDSSVPKVASNDKPAANEVTSVQRVQLNEAYGKLPFRFEINKGQVDSQVQFVARGSGYNLFLTTAESVMVLSASSGSPSRVRGAPAEKSLRNRSRVTSVIRTKLSGSKNNPEITGLEELSGKSNYLIGNDLSKWEVGVSSYARVKYADVYPGIDLVYYGNHGRLEQDFIVGPGSEPRAIKLSFDGVRRLRIDGNGDLVLSVKAGELRQSSL